MSERVIQPHKEGMKRSMKDRITSVAQRNKSTSSPPSTPEQKTPQIQKKHRPIEQVLVGAWNAVKPESQGKAIMKVYDKYIHPKYTTEEERKKAAVIRPKIEKIVGWTALGTEAALITFGAVKGYQKLRSIDWRRYRKTPKSRASGMPGVPSETMPVSLSEMIPPEVALFLKNTESAMQTIMGHLTGPKADFAKEVRQRSGIDVSKISFSPELKVQMADDFFRRFFVELHKPDVIGQVKGVYWHERKDEIRKIMYRVQGRYVSAAIGGEPSYTDVPFADVLKDKIVVEFQDYLRILRDWYLANDCPGISRLGVNLKR